MFNTTRTLELTQKDFDQIEAALHTQQKILSMQSQAGGTGAKTRLNDLRNLIKRVNSQKPRKQQAGGFTFSQMARSLFC